MLIEFLQAQDHEATWKDSEIQSGPGLSQKNILLCSSCLGQGVIQTLYWPTYLGTTNDVCAAMGAEHDLNGGQK